MKLDSKISCFLAAFNLLFLLAHCTLYQSEKKGKDLKAIEGPVDTDVRERGLVVKNPKVKDILTNYAAYHKDTQTVHFEETVLGYVTPWNSKGYKTAELFATRLNLVSPVWLQVRRESGNGIFKITGDHDIDRGWIDRLRKANKNMKIVPRVLFDGWSGHDYSKVLTDSQEQDALAKTITSMCESQKFDGVVLELWSQLGGRVNEPLSALIQRIAQALKTKGHLTILVLPPASGQTPEVFGKEDFERLVQDVDYFSLMTYDFSSVQRPGPSSPLPWMKACVELLAPRQDDPNRKKILLGLNFYGQDFTINGGGPIISHQFVQLLKKAKISDKMKLDTSAEENFIEIKTSDGRHNIFFPTPYSIDRRIQLAKELGTGISIWELGQGLDYFYDLL